MLYHKERELQVKVVEFSAGDEEAFRDIVEMIYADVTNIAYRYLLNQEDAKDAAQIVCLKLYYKLRIYRLFFFGSNFIFILMLV